MKRLICVVVYMLFTSLLFCQTSSYRLEKEPISVPLSPNASSLGKFIQNPIGSYTGIPEIDIPIHDIKVGDINFPINLSYHSGGIKVDEVASWVGLGWSLSGNANISRVVRGKKDGSYDYEKIEKYKNNQFSSLERVQYVIDILEGFVDAEPDLYILSFPGISCEFIKGNDGEFITIPRDMGLRIHRPNDEQWVVTDSKGVQYFFQEYTHVESVSHYRKLGVSHDLGQVNTVNTWYIKKIIDNQNNKVEFDYGTQTYELHNKVAESMDLYISFNPLCTGHEHSGITNFALFTEPVLERIRYNNVTLEFILDAPFRVDLPSTRSLQQIRLFYGNEMIKAFSFHHSYFENDAIGTSYNGFYSYQNQDKYRLRLDSLREYKDGSFIPAYKFDYINSVKLPYRLSNAQDHWGYANGKNNREFVSFEVSGIQRGADKEPNDMYARAFTLKEITFPTGGKRSYEYEGNQTPPSALDIYKDTIVASLYRDNTIRGDEKEVYEISSTIDLTSPDFQQPIRITPNVISEGFTIGSDASYELVLSAPGQLPIIFYNGLSQITVLPGVYTFTVRIFQPIPSDPSNLPFLSVEASLSVKKKPATPTGHIGAPGIRVKRIVHYEKSVPTLIREFDYNVPHTSLSSGEIGGNPYYYVALGKESDCCTCYYQRYVSYSNYPLISTRGSYVGYTFVTETDKAAGSSKKSVYEYSNYRLYNDEVVPGYPFCPSSNQSYKRGLLISKNVYQDIGTAEATLKERKTYNYKVIPNSLKVVYGIKAAEKFFYHFAPNDMRVEQTNVNIYGIYSDAFKLASDTTIRYETDGAVKEINEYSYNSKFLLTRVKSTDSENIVTERIIKYPFDYADNSTLVSMTNANMQSVVIDEVYKRGTKTLRSIKNNYQQRSVNGTPQFVLSSKILSASSNVTDRLTFTVHDNYGNPLEVKKQEGPVTAYLWGYNGQYPIAKIENASYEEVKRALSDPSGTFLNQLSSKAEPSAADLTRLNNLRSHAGMGKAQITTYTYKPLVGMTSKTDPRGITEYYQYDGFQRLKDVLDFDKNVLENYRYHYRP